MGLLVWCLHERAKDKSVDGRERDRQCDDKVARSVPRGCSERRLFFTHSPQLAKTRCTSTKAAVSEEANRTLCRALSF